MGAGGVCPQPIIGSGSVSTSVPLSQTQAMATGTGPLGPNGNGSQAAGPGMVLPCVGSSGCSPATKYVASVSYSAAGVITATAQASSGLKSETFILAPQLSGGRVDWAASGSCKTRAGGALC